jgi:hypothetical protein
MDLTMMEELVTNGERMEDLVRQSEAHSGL